MLTGASSTRKLKWRPTPMKDKLNTFTWEWEDGETGLIRTIKIPMPNLDRDYDPSESHETILDRKPRLDNVEMPDWIKIVPPRNLTDGNDPEVKPRKSAEGNDQF